MDLAPRKSNRRYRKSAPEIFPCFTLSDEEIKVLFVTNTTPSYRSHRLVFERDGKISAFAKSSSRGCLMASIDICPRRLVDTRSLKLVEFSESCTVPPYAALSHRWIQGEEVVYKEFCRPRHDTKTRLKLGYWKIKSACRQARNDGISYLWVDTCCIEQENHADVSMNITSMYAYYQNAEICYAYLADVRTKSDMFDRPNSYGRLGTEWLWRGWTLQELLAPRSVVFFNKDWRRIGDKHELRDEIHRKTAIPKTVVSGEQSIRNVDVLTRMSWSVRRKTSKEQDEAYCLQGLVGVTVEPDYSEYRWTAFNRLGKALLNAQPKLKGRLGISDRVLRNPQSYSFYRLLQDRLDSACHEVEVLNTQAFLPGLKKKQRYVL